MKNDKANTTTEIEEQAIKELATFARIKKLYTDAVSVCWSQRRDIIQLNNGLAKLKVHQEQETLPLSLKVPKVSLSKLEEEIQGSNISKLQRQQMKDLLAQIINTKELALSKMNQEYQNKCDQFSKELSDLHYNVYQEIHSMILDKNRLTILFAKQINNDIKKKVTQYTVDFHCINLERKKQKKKIEEMEEKAEENTLETVKQAVKREVHKEINKLKLTPKVNNTSKKSSNKKKDNRKSTSSMPKNSKASKKKAPDKKKNNSTKRKVSFKKKKTHSTPHQGSSHKQRTQSGNRS
jgi:hypothetical protein